MRVVVFLLLCLSSFNLSAQGGDLNLDNTNEELLAQTEKPEKSVEKIEITGSHIKQVDLEGRTPIQILDREYLEKTGHNSVGDVLRELSANSFGSWREQSGSTAGGVAEVSLRGLGANRTLVLINGRRMAKDGNTGAADLNLIPLTATERIDVLKDSSSAIYGSDAIGGVVNVITKKDFSGVEFSVSQNATELSGGNKTTISGTFGSSSGKTRSLTTLQYRNNEEIYARNREWLHTGYSVFSPVPNVIVKDGTPPQALNHCPPDKLNGGLCRFRWTDYATETPHIEQFNVYSNVQHQITATTELRWEMLGSYKKLFSQYAPGVVALLEDEDALSSSFIDGLNLPGHTAGDPVKVMWRSLMFGPRITEEVTTSYSVNMGLTQYWGESWETNLSLGTERIKRDQRNPGGYAKAKELTDAIKNGVSANGTVCNIFIKGGTCNIHNEVAYAPYQIMRSDLSTLELAGNGEVMELPHGALLAAVGTQFTFEKFSDDYDELSIAGGVLGGGAGSEGRGKRRVQALYTEFSIPLLTNMEFNVAGRYDRYSDFGDTFNPKASIMYRPIDNLLLRASGGTGFKAPDMNAIYAQESEGYPTFIDHAGCAKGIADTCSPAQYLVKYKRPQDLKEERSSNANIGAVYQATESLSLGLDIFYTHIKDSIGTDLNELTQAERAGVNLSQYHTTVNRNALGKIESIETQDLNIAQTRLNGADLELKFKKNFPNIGTIAINNTASYLFRYKSQGFPGTPFKSILKDNGNPQWRNMLTLGYEPNDSLYFSTIITTIGKHAQLVKGSGDLKSYTSLNTQVGYYIGPEWGKVTVGVDNLLKSTPPLDSSIPDIPVVVALYNNFGRVFSLGYTVNF